MKKLLLGAILLCSVVSFGQSINGTKLTDLDTEYLEVVGTSKLFSRDLTIQLDFGQKVKFFTTGKEILLKDESGNQIEFHSMIDVLNYMSKFGYEFVTAYAVTMQNQNVYHYLLKKKHV